MSCTRSLGSLLTCGFPTLGLSLFFFYFATGAFHKLTGDSLIVLEGTVGRYCRAVTNTINSLLYTKLKRKRTPQNQTLCIGIYFFQLGMLISKRKPKAAPRKSIKVTRRSLMNAFKTLRIIGQ